jgi:FtsZ-interacting cell division protein ZipA
MVTGMSTTLVIAVVVAIIILALIAAAVSRRRHSEQLKERYGAEYDYTLEKVGDQRTAEAELEKREKRIEALDIRNLSPEERDRFQKEWVATQAQFVDEPRQAVIRADRLIQEVMRERGFPVADFEQRAADVSVLYPDVVPNYRQSHEIAIRSDRNEASTEDLRQAMVNFRSLFEDLLHEPQTKENRV